MLSARRLLLAVAISSTLRAVVSAECVGGRPDVCALINSDREIFVGRILGPVTDNPVEWRMHVVRSYRGAATGDIVVQVWGGGDLPSFATLTIGESYLFYVSKTVEDGALTRSTPMGCGVDWLPLSAVPRKELDFLSRLNSPSDDGRVSGTLGQSYDARNRQPLPGIRILLNDGKKTYARTTNRKGEFDIRGLPAGKYQLSTTVPNTLLVEMDDDRIEIVPHGCYEAFLMAEINTTISGRITLPEGVKVVGTEVIALTVTGRFVKSTYADPQGRYTIPGLDPGEYVVGINARGLPPGIDAPFPPTYAPGTADLAQARRIRISGPAAFADVDVSVRTASDIALIAFTARSEDGRPVDDSPISLDSPGGSRGIGRTGADGVATLRIVKGATGYVTGGAMSAGCMTPLLIGPDMYPEAIAATYTRDGCREHFNLEELNMLHNSVPGAIGRMPVLVTFPDGSPAYKAQVSIVSRSRVPYSAGFQTDKDGGLDMPAPVDQEFTIDASFFESGVSCQSDELLFNTERGIRLATKTDRNSRPNWDDVPPVIGEIRIVLAGPKCRTP
jgi:hypothetical protein